MLNDINLCDSLRCYNIFFKFKNKFIMSKYINNFRTKFIIHSIAKMIKEMKQKLYICKFKRQYKYGKFIIKNDLKKYILKFKNNFYKDNSNAIKILFDYFIIYNNINLDIYLTKKQAEQLIKLFLWKNCLDYKNFNVIYEKEKYYFKDITNIFSQDNKLKNYVLSYYKSPSDVPY